MCLNMLGIEYIFNGYLESIKIIYAILYLSIFSYYDVRNDREIPDKIVYSLSGIAYLFLLTYPINTAIFAALQGVIIFASVYLLYRMGQMGLAEGFSLSSLAVLFPYPPAIAGISDLPFIFFIFVFSGLLFAVFIVFYSLYKIRKMSKKITYKEVILLLLYLIFLYIFFTSGFGNMIFVLVISILFFSSFIANMFKDEIKKSFVYEISIDKAREEVFAYEYSSEKEREVLGNVKVIGEKEIKKLKKAKLKKVHIYKMFPFSPFLLGGFLMSLLFSSLLIFI